LAASSEDYRDLQNQISSARTALLVASLMYLVIGAIAFSGSSQPNETTPPILGAAFFIDAVVATVFLFLWWFARTRPAFSMLLAAALWLALQLLLSLTFPVLVWSGLWFKAVVAILMIRGIIAALRANVFLQKLRGAAQQAVEVGTRLLKYLVPWGDAVFNQAQADDLESDIADVKRAQSDRDLLEMLDAIEPLVSRLRREAHVYLWFVGD